MQPNSDENPVNESTDNPFVLGVHYWPAHTGIYGWRLFDKARLAEDFLRIRETGLSCVRVFLLWEDFQPRPKKVVTSCLDHLVETAEQADRQGLKIMPTFFTGHMSGLNWLPPWTLWAREATGRFPVFSMDKVRTSLPRNFYEDAEIIEAQVLLVREVSGALEGHPALWAWDLGHAPSRVVRPPDREAGSLWLRVMTEELRKRDETVPITLGMHAEALGMEGELRPEDLAAHLDFLTVEASPLECAFADGPFDTYLSSFLGILVRWLGNKEVLVAGLGLSTEPASFSEWKGKEAQTFPLSSEEDASTFYPSALDRLLEGGGMGVLLGGFSDYDPELWKYPPLDNHVHERFFGIFRHDGSPKRFQPLLKDYTGLEQRPFPGEFPGWIDISPEDYWENPANHIRRLYRNYREHCG